MRAKSTVSTTEPYAAGVEVGETPTGLQDLSDTMVEPSLERDIVDTVPDPALKPVGTRRPASRTPVVNRPPDAARAEPEPAPAGRRTPTRPAAASPEPEKRQPVVRAGTSDRHDAPTIMEMSALTDRDLAAEQPTIAELPAVQVPEERKRPVIRASQSVGAAAREKLAEAAAPEPEPAQADEAGRRFSETAWFLAAVNPENLEEGEATDFSKQEEMTERYEVPGRLPEDVRKSFSLTKSHKTLDPDEARKKKK